jgi:hypothetical protein
MRTISKYETERVVSMLARDAIKRVGAKGEIDWDMYPRSPVDDSVTLVMRRGIGLALEGYSWNLDMGLLWDAGIDYEHKIVDMIDQTLGALAERFRRVGFRIGTRSKMRMTHG